ncbi:hypothetical protein ACK8P5_26715 (plasmid) [Paenibacillus sp. EC2-1]|uniref:hypothetical protein n=1 Tax=Paenibacillus sp. EC2-1 TaxID=3388665 RepID=UPI003BEED57E
MSKIQQSTSPLRDTQEKVLRALITDRHKDDGATRDFIEQEIATIISAMDGGKPALTLRPQNGLTNATNINEEFMEYQIDINTLYDQLNHVSERVNQHQKLNDSVLNDISIKIRKVEEQLQEYDQLIRDRSAHGVFLETFIDSNSVEKDQKYYTDRDGTPIPPAYRATLDVHKNALKLPVLYKENAIVNFNGLKLANIKITKQLGGGFIRTRNPEQDIDKAFDTSLETFWNETILTDSPFEVDLGLEYYGINFGAVCELEINFDYISKINEITFTPFVNYPIEVVAVIAYTTDRNEESGFEIVSPSSALRSSESADIISFQFPEIVCKRLKIILNQRHYVKQDIIMDIEDKSLTDAWLQSQGHIDISADKIFKPVYQDKLEITPHWAYLSKFLEERDVVHEINKSSDDARLQRTQASKYEYQYGFSNIAVGRNEYHTTGVYVTTPLIKGNIHRASLETVEEHPALSQINLSVTNIEYYLTDKEDPGVNDWHPILPNNVSDIFSEPLFFILENGIYKAAARFAVKNIIAVRENGRPLTAGRDYTMIGRSINMMNYNLSSVYTIDYVPENSAYYVDFLNLYTRSGKTHASTQTDQFENVRNEVVLSRSPFVDKERLNAQGLNYQPSYLSNEYLPMTVQVILPDGQRIEQPVAVGDDSVGILNMTNYFQPKVSMLGAFSGENYQYRVIDNVVKFNTELPAGSIVTVRYSYLTGPIRMKAILRRNLHEMDGLTPFLNEYKVVFQSLI